MAHRKTKNVTKEIKKNQDEGTSAKHKAALKAKAAARAKRAKRNKA